MMTSAACHRDRLSAGDVATLTTPFLDLVPELPSVISAGGRSAMPKSRSRKRRSSSRRQAPARPALQVDREPDDAGPRARGPGGRRRRASGRCGRALSLHRSVPMFRRSTHGDRLQQLTELGSDAPGRMLNRWVTTRPGAAVDRRRPARDQPGVAARGTDGLSRPHPLQRIGRAGPSRCCRRSSSATGWSDRPMSTSSAPCVGSSTFAPRPSCSSAPTSSPLGRCAHARLRVEYSTVADPADARAGPDLG